EIESLLKDSKAERELVLSELDKNQEIEIFDLKEKGCMINDKHGLAAFDSKKYKKMNEDIIIDWIKVFVQIVVPILSLVITILVILKDDSKTTKEIQAIEQKIQSLKGNIESLELNQKTPPNHKTDSL